MTSLLFNPTHARTCPLQSPTFTPPSPIAPPAMAASSSITTPPSQVCLPPGKSLHEYEDNHLLVFDGGKFWCVAVPELGSSSCTSVADAGRLCFRAHNNKSSERWRSIAEEEDCCLREGGHVHAHIHHGDITEEVLLEQCMDEVGCALRLPWELHGTCLDDTSHDQDHQCREGDRHNQIIHGDHFDLLVPTTDGSFLLSHAEDIGANASCSIEHGRIKKIGESFGRMSMQSKQLLHIFGFENPRRKGYVSVSQDEKTFEDTYNIQGTMISTNSTQSLQPPSETEKLLTQEGMVKVNIPSNFRGYALQKTALDVLGICCPAEAILIKRLLKPLPGVQEVSVNVTSKTAIVLHEAALTSDGQLVKVLNEARLMASIHRTGQWKAANKWPSPYTVASGILVVIAFFHYIFSPLEWVALGAVAVGTPPMVMRSLVSLRHCILDINVLMLIAVAGAIGLGDYLEAGSIVFLFTLADWLESRSSDQARLTISAIMNLAPQSAVLADNGLRVPVAEVKVGTSMSVKAGESIPIDGTVISGSSSVDESSLTGESVPVEKGAGCTVWAGTLNMSGYLIVETTALAEDSAVARMVRLVEEAQSQRSRTEQFVEQFAKYYTPAVVIAALAVAIIPSAIHVNNTRHWLYLALVLLVVSCPCALVISTPVTTTCGIAQAARIGLLIKGGKFLEVLGKIKVVAMDKTGTLTEGHFRVAEMLPFHDIPNLHQILYWISSVESKSSHPMASTLVAYARLQGVEPSGEVEGFEILPGEGIFGIVDGHRIYIGNQRLATRLNWIEATDPTILERWSNQGSSICWIGMEENPLGVFCVADQLRPEAVEAVSYIKKLNLRIAMLTGDSVAVANTVHRQLGEMEVHAELFPEDKVRVVKELKELGMTAMVGDGINDAPALAAADVGIAMGVAGSAVAMETADIALMTNDLRKLVAAIKLGRKSRTKIMQNVVLSFATKGLIIALAAAGYASLWAAVVADVGTCLVVIFNSMLLLDRKKGSDICRGHEGHSYNKKGWFYHFKKKKNMEEGDCCLKSDSSKPANISTCCKFKGELARREDPAYGTFSTNVTGRCCGSDEELHHSVVNFSVTKSCCEVNCKNTSKAIRRRSGSKESCSKDCQGVDCSTFVSIFEEIGPNVVGSNSGPDHVTPCQGAYNNYLQGGCKEQPDEISDSKHFCDYSEVSVRNQVTGLPVSYCGTGHYKDDDCCKSSQNPQAPNDTARKMVKKEVQSCNAKDSKCVDCLAEKTKSMMASSVHLHSETCEPYSKSFLMKQDCACCNPKDEHVDLLDPAFSRCCKTGASSCYCSNKDLPDVKNSLVEKSCCEESLESPRIGTQKVLRDMKDCSEDCQSDGCSLVNISEGLEQSAVGVNYSVAKSCCENCEKGLEGTRMGTQKILRDIQDCMGDCQQAGGSLESLCEVLEQSEVAANCLPVNVEHYQEACNPFMQDNKEPHEERHNTKLEIQQHTTYCDVSVKNQDTTLCMIDSTLVGGKGNQCCETSSQNLLALNCRSRTVKKVDTDLCGKDCQDLNSTALGTSQSVPMKLADPSACCKFKVKLASPQGPSHGCCDMTGAGHCCGRNEDLQLYVDDCCSSKSSREEVCTSSVIGMQKKKRIQGRFPKRWSNNGLFFFD